MRAQALHHHGRGRSEAAPEFRASEPRSEIRTGTKEFSMRSVLSSIVGLAAGTVAMYYLDPEMGRRRRALAIDQMEALSHHAGDLAEVYRKRTVHRLEGWLAAARQLNQAGEIPEDDQLRERIRARLGHMVSHPRAIQVKVDQGDVTLSGKILTHEVERMLSAIARLAGVRKVDQELSVYPEAGNIPELQGSGIPGAGKTKFRPALPFVALMVPVAMLLGATARSAMRNNAAPRLPSGMSRRI